MSLLTIKLHKLGWSSVHPAVGNRPEASLAKFLSTDSIETSTPEITSFAVSTSETTRRYNSEFGGFMRKSRHSTGKKRKVRYAVVGLGYISQIAVLPAFAHARQNSELTALVSGDHQKLRALSRKYNVSHAYSYERYSDCLDSGEIDAVYIALPNHMHRAYTEGAAEAGIHVLCEKPMALDEADCEAMIVAAEKKHIKLMIAYRLHFERGNLDAIEMIKSGKIGEPRIFTSVFSQQDKYVEYIKQVVKSLKSRNGEPVHKRTWDAETMDLPVVKYREQRRPALKAKAVSQLIADSAGQERVLYVLLGATGMRISEALAIETQHFVNEARTVKVEQQVDKDAPRIVKYLKTDTAHREIDLHPDVAEFLQRYMAGKEGLLFHTRRNTPHLYGNLEERWLTPRLAKMGLDEGGMGWHSFKRFRKTWLRGRRCLEDINNFWMAHKPETMSELYSHLHEEVDVRLAEAESVGYGFDLPKIVVAPNAPKKPL